MNICNYIDEQLSERYKAFIICGAGLTGKSSLAKSISKRKNIYYLDLLETFIKSKDLSSKVDVIKPKKIFDLIDSFEEKDILIVDQLDFLFSLWTETLQQEFIRRLNLRSNGICIIAILHNYKIFEQEGIMTLNSRGHKRIVNIADIDNI